MANGVKANAERPASQRGKRLVSNAEDLSKKLGVSFQQVRRACLFDMLPVFGITLGERSVIDKATQFLSRTTKPPTCDKPLPLPNRH
jgi:hypothetical protein